jgi:hypothetical protein
VCHIVLQTSVSVNVDQANSNVPSVFKLDAYPNPFNLSCKIEYALPDNSGTYRMEIIDVMGRVIKTYRKLSRIGYILWDGTNENYQVVASGVYCVIVHRDGHRFVSKRIVLMK